MNEFELTSRIVECSEHYYMGEPIISDEEFDRLVEKLRELNPDNPVLRTPGWGYSIEKSELGKVTHQFGVMNGLPKSKVEPTHKLKTGKVYSPKIDGTSLEILYVEGIYQGASTRGNGVVGLDVSDKVKYLVPLVLPYPDTVSFRGEFALDYDTFNKYYSDAPSPRNISSGILNRTSVDPQEIKRFTAVIYRIQGLVREVSPEPSFNTREYVRDYIANCGFNTLPVSRPVDEITYQEMYEDLSMLMDKKYPLDGLVEDPYYVGLTTDGQFEGVEGTKFIMEYTDSLAYKTITETASVVVTDVKYNLTRTHKLVPTVEYEAVELSGASLTHALGHNARYILDNKIGIGSTIEIVRSGEVIPYILDVLEPAEPLLCDTCPVCGAKVEWSGVHLVCNNPECSSKSTSRLKSWINTVAENVKGLGGSLVNTIIEVLSAQTITDLYANYNIDKFSGVSGLGYSKLNLIIETFETLNAPINIDRFLVALSLDGLSWKSASNLNNPQFYKLLKSQDTEGIMLYLADVKGVMWKSKDDLINNLDMIYGLLDFVRLVEPTESTKVELTPSEDLIPICVTGKLFSFKNRKEIFNTYKDKIRETKVEHAKYLVCNEDKGSSKTKYAKANGIEIITEEQLIELLK